MIHIRKPGKQPTEATSCPVRSFLHRLPKLFIYPLKATTSLYSGGTKIYIRPFKSLQLL